MTGLLVATPAERRLIPSDGLRGPVPVLIGIMMFVMMMVAAAGLALANASSVVSRGIEHRYTIQIADGEAKAAAALATARTARGAGRVTQVPPDDLRRTLERWLGPDSASANLPLPVIIDVDLDDPSDAATLSARLAKSVPGAKLVAHRDSLGPLLTALRGLGLLTLALVVLIASASAAAVVLAARGALDTHRGTVEVMHGLGATDEQVARLFQRQIAIDAFVGAVAGAALAALVLLLFAGGARFASLFVGAAPLGWKDVLLMAALPPLATALATVVARVAVLRALRERL